MKQELVRIKSIDGIELVGLLSSPREKTNKIVVHVHGLNGNFYENRFLDILATSYTNNNYAFLSFNNRGREFITEFIKNDSFVTIGGSLERFKDSILDIEGVLNWVKDQGYQDIILEGHSYGCSKVLYSYNKLHNLNIKKIVLLAPCDTPAECMKFLSKEEYEKNKLDATKLVNDGKENELINFSVMANNKIAAGTYYNDFLPGGENDFIRYRDGANGKSEILNDIEIPVYITFGNQDECVLTENIDVIETYLKNNIKNCYIQIIDGADHSYTNKFIELEKFINNIFEEVK